MQFDSATPRNDITVAGIKLSAVAPFAEGHPLTAAEAGVLNQTLAENFRNNFAGQVAKAQELAKAAGSELDIPALQAAFEAYQAEYSFGVRKTGTPRVVDPVEREALSLAREAVKQALAKKGVKVGDGEGQLPKANFDALVTQYAASEPVLKIARKRVKEMAAISIEDLGLTPAASAPSETSAAEGTPA